MSRSPIDAYITGFPAPIQERLIAMRSTIQAAAPQATETISYAMPTFVLHGNLVHFAAFTNHTGFYPGSSGVAAFEHELAGFVHAKGSIQFPHDQPLPLDLVSRIVAFRLAENLAKAERKRKKSSQ